MKAKKLEALVRKILDDNKAQEIVELDIRELTDIADAMIICTGTSRRHTQSLADHVVEETEALGNHTIGVEGKLDGDWILIDLGDVIVHIMLAETRQFYSLEKLWTSAKALRTNEN